MSQKLPADLEQKISSFTSFVRDLRLDNDFDDEFIINMDETPVFFDLVPNKTVSVKGSKSVIVRTSGSDKKHVTVMLAVAANGSYRDLQRQASTKRHKNAKRLHRCRPRKSVGQRDHEAMG